MKNYAQIKAIEKQNKERWLKVCPTLTDECGIYILTREDELGVKYAYIGQSVNILTRLAQHLVGYQHIDLSLKKHKLYSDKNPYGWSVDFFTCLPSELDANERYYILEYAKTHQMRNVSSGGQGQGKSQLGEQNNVNGYYKGLKQGYENCRKEIKVYFNKYLDFTIKEKSNKIKEKKYNNFKNWLNEGDNENV